MIESAKSANAEMMPNLLDLVEAHDAVAVWGSDLSVATDEGADGGQLPISSADALCSDERQLTSATGSLSVCADEIEPGQPQTLMTELSICADELSDTIGPNINSASR